MSVRRVQEWLSFHGFATGIDEDFGSATETATRLFQQNRGIPATGIIDEATWEQLVRPLHRVLAPANVGPNAALGDVLFGFAQQHLTEHPIELGGDNRGPWVRLYMNGKEGSEWYWCAGFVTFLLKQACTQAGIRMPIEGSFSCDSLAYQAKSANLFVSDAELKSGKVRWQDLGPIPIFLVRRTATDWTHTGFAFDGNGEAFSTIEGNTNDEGSHNGYEVCRRVRNLAGKDFIRLNVF